MYEYEKTLLYAYPRIGYYRAMYGELADTKIKLSYYDEGSTEELVADILACLTLKQALADVKDKMDEALKGLTEDELCLLEYRFFRRKKKLAAYSGHVFPFAYSTMFRRVRKAVQKFSLSLHRLGYDEKKFFADFSSCQIVMRAYGKVANGEDRCFLRGKEMNFIFAAPKPLPRAPLAEGEKASSQSP